MTRGLYCRFPRVTLKTHTIGLLYDQFHSPEFAALTFRTAQEGFDCAHGYRGRGQ